MSYSPRADGDTGSPDIFLSNVRCNLDSQFLNARDSIKCENMSVYARVRPMLAHEKARGFKECLAAIDEQTVRVVVPVTSSKYKSSRQNDEIIEDYTFSASFGPETGQFVFFQETMLNTMQNFIEGSNSLVFSYGITGSGKTYTLQGDVENPGVIPLSMKLYFGTIEKQIMKEMVVKPRHYCDIISLSEKDRQQEQMIKKQLLSLYDEEHDSTSGGFSSYNSKSFAMSLCEFFYDSYEPEERLTTLSSEDMAASQAACQLKEISRKCADQQPGVCSVWVSFVEIYNETIFDLLQPFSNKRAKLSLGEDKNGNVYIKGVREICVSNSEEALKILNIGRKELSIASTKMNYQSSRSHCIYTLRVVRVPDPQNISYGKVNRLSFCDLAGSERASKTQTTGIRLKEAGAINTSLLVLGRCLEQLRMNQLGKEKRMIPFRESKLTRLFSGFFLGQGKAAIIANASPSDYSFDETLHVLKFSALAKKIIVNDTFLSNASSTLENITNQWHNFKANMSTINDSMESVDSDSDIIEKKDELIEKLLKLAEEQGNELAKEKKEKADLEMKIRQQVCREYSEFSDQIIESHRLNHEEERNSVIEIYKKRIANMERMYENVIKGYKEQLRDYETDESLNESSAAGNDSQNELDISDRKSFTKTPDFGSLKKDATERPKTTFSPNLDVESLKSRLSAISNELQNTNALLLESQNASSNLEIELSISKAENENLACKIAEYQNAESKYASVTSEYESQLKDLEKKLSVARDELSVAKEQVQLKAFNVCELDTEMEVCKNEIEILKKVNAELKNMTTSSEATIKQYKQTIAELEQKYLVSQHDLEVQKELVKSHSNEVCDFKKEIDDCKKEYEKLKSFSQETCENSKKLKLDIQKYKETLCSLEEENTSLKSKMKLLQENEAKLQAVPHLQQEINECKEEYEKLKSFSQETCEKLKCDIQKYKEALCSLEEENISLKSKMKLLQENEAKLLSMSHLQQEINECKKECEKLRSLSQETSEESEKLKLSIQKYKETLCLLEEENTSLKNKIKLLQESEVKLQSMSHLQEEIAVCKKEYEKLRSFSQETSEESEKLKLNIQKYKETLCLLEEENTSLKSKVKLLLENEAKLQSISHLQEEIESHKLGIEKMNKEKVKLENDNVKLKTEITKYESAVSELELDLSSANNEISMLKSKVQQKTEKFVKLQNELESYQKKLAELQKLEDTDSGNSESSCSPETYKSKIKKLEKELSSACQQLEASKIHLELNSLDASDFEFQIKEGKKKLETLKKEKESEKIHIMKKLKNSEEKLSAIIIQSEDQKKEWLKKIEELEKEVKTSKASTKKLEDYQETLLAEKLELSTEIHTYETTRKVLEDKLVSKDKELKMVRDKISNLLKESENKTKVYEDKIHKLQKDRECFENEKRELISSILLTHQTEKKSLEDKLASVQNDLQIAKQDVQEIHPILSDIENRVEGYKQEITKLKENQELSEKEKEDLRTIILKNEEKIEDLEKRLSLSNLELKSIKDELLHKNKNVQELEDKMKSIMADIDKLQKALEQADAEKSKLNSEIASNKGQIKDIEEKLSNTKMELDSTKKEVKEKTSKLQELENDNHIYKCELKNYSSVSKLADEVDITYKNQAEVYRETISTLEGNLESVKEELKFNQEKLKIQSLNCRELEAEATQLKEELDRKELKLKDALGTLKELEEAYDNNCDQLKELPTLQEEKKTLEEKHALLTEKLASLTLEHQALIEKLSIEDEATVTLKKHIETLEKEMKVMLTLAAVLQNCEIKATYRTTDLLSKAKSHQMQIIDLNRQISDKECNIEDIEKALLKSQHQLKDVQASCDKKLISEKEQHEVEVEEVMKLKQLVEEENVYLKKEISNVKQLSEEEKLHLKNEISNVKQLSEEEKLNLKKEISILKQLSEVKNQPKKEQLKKETSNLRQLPEVKKEQSNSEKKQPMRQNLKGKSEEQPKAIKRTESTSSEILKTSRALRHKQVRDTNVISEISRTTDVEIEVPKRESRKRTSDEDFEKTSATRASKKMKSSEDNKIPVLRTSRRKLQVESEQNISPVQKMANCIGQKFRNLSESVSKLSSPRMTRGKRKLYNPETSSSSSASTGKITRSNRRP